MTLQNNRATQHTELLLFIEIKVTPNIPILGKVAPVLNYLSTTP
jgi:hypothetical protein